MTTKQSLAELKKLRSKRSGKVKEWSRAEIEKVQTRLAPLSPPLPQHVYSIKIRNAEGKFAEVTEHIGPSLVAISERLGVSFDDIVYCSKRINGETKHQMAKYWDAPKERQPVTDEQKKELRERLKLARAVREYNRAPNAEGKGKKENPMSEGTAEAVKEMRENQARGKKAKAGKPTVEAKKEEKETTMKTSTKKKAIKKAAPKSGKRVAAEKPAAAKQVVKKETFSVPDEFTRSFEGKDHEVKKTKDGWTVDGKEPVPSLREAMIAILKAHKKEVGHRAASYFFANVKKAS